MDNKFKPLIKRVAHGFYTVHDPETSERIGSISGRWVQYRHRSMYTARVHGAVVGEYTSAAAAQRAVRGESKAAV